MKSTRTKRTGRNKSPGARVHNLTVFILVMILLLQAPTMASDDTSNTEDLIRAAMVYNFCKFVQWPENHQINHLVLGVMSDGFSAPDFSSIDGKTVQNKTLEVRSVSSRSELTGCNLVYITPSRETALQETFAESQNESILTISEIEGFCTQGGIIQMVPRRGKMRFFINRQAADRTGLTLSSQLLKMARIVRED